MAEPVEGDNARRLRPGAGINNYPRVDPGIAPVENALREKGSEINFNQYGIYFDDMARIDGDWKFTHRLFVPIYMTGGSVTGDVLTPRTGLARPT
jgi:hypothetical protein